MTSEEVATRILQEAHVLMLPGNAFGACGEGYLRMACTVDKAVIEEAFARIGKPVDKEADLCYKSCCKGQKCA